MPLQIPSTVEIWDHILKSVNTEDKLALATTCSILHPIARASLWRKIKLEVHNTSPKHKIFKTLATKPVLGALVCDLHIYFGYGAAYPAATVTMGHELLRRLTSLCNIRFLTVSAFEVDVTFCSIVAAQWRQLSSITFDGCIVSTNHLPGTLCEGFPTAVTIIRPRSMNGWSILTHAKLRKLEFRGEREAPNGTASLPMSSEGALTELILAGNLQIDITPLLNAAPRLRRLTLPESYRHSEIPPDAFKELEYIAGYADCAAPFVHGRPIRGAHIFLRDTSSSEVLRLLEHSTTLVTDLKVTKYSTQDFSEIMKHAPMTLCNLSLEGKCNEEDLVELILILNQQPNMLVISLELGFWVDDFMKQILSKQSEGFANLREVRVISICDMMIWQRKEGKRWLGPLRRISDWDDEQRKALGTWVSDYLLSRSLWTRSVDNIMDYIQRVARDNPQYFYGSGSGSSSGFSFSSS